MGNYALPALDVKTPQQPDLLEKFSQLSALRNSQQQQQMQQQEAPARMQILGQQAQAGALDVQQKQQALTDQKATTQALTQWDGKDINDLYPLVLKNGGSATAVFGMKKDALDQQHTAAETFKSQADAGKAQIETLKQKGDLINGALMPLTDPKQVPDDQLPQVLQSTVQDLVQKGLLDPQHAQTATRLAQSGDPNAIRQGISQFGKTFMAQSQILEEAHKTALEANQQAERQQAAANAAQTANHNAVEEKQGQQRISIEGARLAFDKARQGTQDQQSIESQAQQIAKYDVKGLTQSRNNPFSRAVMQRVYEINPGYSDEGYATNQDFLSSKGKANAQVQSLNKVAEHLSDLRDASNTAGFTPFGITGSGKALSTAEQVFGTEDIKYLSGTGVGSQAELEKLHENIHSSITSVRNDALDQLAKMTASAARQLGSQYERGTKLPFDPSQHFNAKAQELLKTYPGAHPASGVAPSNGMVTVQIPGSPAGQIPAAALAKFKADHPNAQVTQ